MSEESQEMGQKNLEATAELKYEIYIEWHMPIIQRSILVITVMVLVILSTIGNVATFVVAVQRNIRPVSRTCLISLALSDLVCCSTTTIRFLGALLSAMPQLWNLGPSICYILPFLKIIGPLVNSLTLLAISFDRYLSVRCVMRRLWEPGGKWCIVIAVCVWGTSAAIASPSITAYHYYPALIVQLNGSANDTHISSEIPGHICGILKETNAHYYLAIFCVVFFPIMTAFVWLNTFLAMDIWKRRKGVPSPSENTSSDIQETSTKDGMTHDQNQSQTQIQAHFRQLRKIREKHQLRTIRLIILITISYMVLKLPEWVFLLITFYNRTAKGTPWILPFVFGIISMVSGVINPLLYAFVTQTMDHLREFYSSIKHFCAIFCQRSVQIWSSVVIVSEHGSVRDSVSEQFGENESRNNVV